MGDVIQESGDATKAFTYLLFEEVMATYSKMRKDNRYGYYYGSASNLPGQGPNNGVTSGGVLIPYVIGGSKKEFTYWEPDGSGRTNCSCSTMNAFAVAVSHADYSPPQGKHKGKTFRVAVVGHDVLPMGFYSIWQIFADEKDAQKGRGCARAIQKYNVGPRVKGHLVRRGDFVQLSWKEESPDDGHSVLCWHARRISDDETRFLIASAQVDTFGVGVRMNLHSLKALESGVKKEASQGSFSGGYVDHQEETGGGDFESPAFVERALRHGHWFLARGSDGDGGAKCPVKQGSGGFHRAWVARPARPFPCFPISLSGKRSPAFVDTDHMAGKDGHATGADDAAAHLEDEHAVAEIYYRNTEEGRGGFFPIGGSRTWHGGVHLSPDGDDKVYAAFDGRVVCARLAPPDEKKWHGTSPSFVLLKHALEVKGAKHEFWTLAMHLRQDALPESGPDPRLALPWMRDLVLAPEAGTPAAALGDGDGWKKLCLKVRKVSSQNPPKLGEKPIAAGDVLAFDPNDAVSIGIWAGRLKNVAAAQRPECERVLSTDASGKLVKGDGAKGKFEPHRFEDGWLEEYDPFPAKFAKKKKDLDEGKVVDLWDEAIVVGAGEPIGRVGEVEGSSALHFELFSEKMIPCWTDKATVKEDDPALFIDRKKFTEKFFSLLDDGMKDLKGVLDHMIDGPAKKKDGMLTRDEIQRFYAENADAKKFREIVTCHPSEWSEAAKHDQLDKNGKSILGFLTDAVLKEHKEHALQYVFWDKNLKSKGLPGSMTVHHYHPIRFIEWIDGLREEESAGGNGAKLHESVVELNHKVS